MTYQLVIQCKAASLSDYDTLIALENRLISLESDLYEVDGHDSGASEMNLFLLSDDPRAAFRSIAPFLHELASASNMRVAFRATNHETFTILWPPGCLDFGIA